MEDKIISWSSILIFLFILGFQLYTHNNFPATFNFLYGGAFFLSLNNLMKGGIIKHGKYSSR